MSRTSELRVLYCNLMEEIKRRHVVVVSAAKGTFRLPRRAAIELCYLQLRMICELIALASLAAHGDIAGTRTSKLRKAWAADDILRAMEGLNADFYPRPAEQILHGGGKLREVRPITEGYLTKRELLKLYAECGEILHRGAWEAVATPKSLDFDKIENYSDRIIKLLSHHAITLSDPSFELWVIMRARGDGRVHATLMQLLTGIGSTPIKPARAPW